MADNEVKSTLELDIDTNIEEIKEIENQIKSIEDFQKSDEYVKYLEKTKFVERTEDPKLKERRKKELAEDYSHISDSSEDIVAQKREELELVKNEIKMKVSKRFDEIELKKPQIEINIKKLEAYIKSIETSIESNKERLEIAKDKDDVESTVIQAAINGLEISKTELVKKIEGYKQDLAEVEKGINNFKTKYKEYIIDKEKNKDKINKDKPNEENTHNKESEEDKKIKDNQEKDNEKVPKTNEYTASSPKRSEEVEEKNSKEKYVHIQKLIVKAKKARKGDIELTDNEARFIMDIMCDEGNFKKYGIRTRGFFAAFGFRKFGNESQILIEAVGKHIGIKKSVLENIVNDFESPSVKESLQGLKDEEQNMEATRNMSNAKKIMQLATSNDEKDWRLSKITKTALDSIDGEELSEDDMFRKERLLEFNDDIESFKSASKVFTSVYFKDNYKGRKELPESFNENEKEEQETVENTFEEDLKAFTESEIITENIPPKAKEKESKIK